MNNSPHNELLSGWFDGELNPSERELVDRQIKESQAIRDECDQMSTVSQRIRDLPRVLAPADFADRVQSAIETRSATQHRTEAASTFRRRWLRSLAVCASLATVVLVAMSSQFGQFDEGTTVVESAGWREFAPSNADAFGRKTIEQPQSPSAAVSPAAVSPAAVSPAAGIAATQAGGGVLNFSSDLKHLAVGDVIEAFDTTSGSVSVVRLTVVDRNQGLEQLELLLARHQIPTDANHHRDGYAVPDMADADDPLGLVAVYVTASPEQLAGVIREIQMEESFSRFDLEPPEYARIDRELLDRIVADIDQTLAADGQADIAVAAAGSQLPPSTASSTADPATSANTTASRPSAALAEVTASAAGRQRIVHLPSALVEGGSPHIVNDPSVPVADDPYPPAPSPSMLKPTTPRVAMNLRRNNRLAANDGAIQILIVVEGGPDRIKVNPATTGSQGNGAA